MLALQSRQLLRLAGSHSAYGAMRTWLRLHCRCSISNRNRRHHWRALRRRYILCGRFGGACGLLAGPILRYCRRRGAYRLLRRWLLLRTGRYIAHSEQHH